MLQLNSVTRSSIYYNEHIHTTLTHNYTSSLEIKTFTFSCKFAYECLPSNQEINITTSQVDKMFAHNFACNSLSPIKRQWKTGTVRQRLTMLCLVIAVTREAFLILHVFPASNVSLLFALETCSFLSVFCNKKLACKAGFWKEGARE